MRNKIIYFILGILLFSGLMSLTIPQTRANAGLYEQQTDPSNPFLFTVDIIYTTSDGYFTTNEVQTFYHQVYLEEDKYYVFYLSNGYISMSNYMRFHSAISTAIDSYTEYSIDTSFGRYLLYINPANTGLYNITIECGEEGKFVSTSGSIGVLEIPIIQLNTKIKMSYWDFTSNPVMIGIINLESGKEYQTGSNGIPSDYSNYEIYYTCINSMYSLEVLDKSNMRMDYKYDDIITTSNLGYGYGKYLFYSFSLSSFSLMESIEEEEENSTDSTTPPNISGIIIWVVIFSIIGIVSIIGIYKLKLSKKKNELIPRWTKKTELPEEKKYCSNCGQEIKKESTFCEFCGNKQ